MKNSDFELSAGYAGHSADVYDLDGRAISTAERGEDNPPAGWNLWYIWDQSPPLWDSNNTVGHAQPESKYNAHDERVHQGQSGWMMFSFYRIHRGGLYQQIAAEPGQTYRFTIHNHAWSSTDDNPRTSDGAGSDAYFKRLKDINAPADDAVWNYSARVGIDPAGGTDPFADSVVWGDWAAVYNAYRKLPAVEAMAESSHITIFTEHCFLWPFKHCDAYYESAVLEAVSQEEPTPPSGQLQRSKMGVHLIGDNGFVDTLRELVAEGYSLTTVKACASIGVLKDVKAIDPDIVTVGRFIDGVDASVDVEGPNLSGDLRAEAERVMDSLLPLWHQHRDYVDYWEIVNEHDPVGTDGHHRLAQFHNHCIDIAESEGFKVASLSYSLGVPEYDEMEAVEASGLLDITPALALHEYAYPINKWFGDAIPGAPAEIDRGPLAFRYRFWEDFGQSGRLAQGDSENRPAPEMPPTFITEMNLARDMPDISAAEWLTQLMWYAEGLNQDDYVIGAHVFTWGGNDWQAFDISQEPFRSAYKQLVKKTVVGADLQPLPEVGLPVEPYDKHYNIIEADVGEARRIEIYTILAREQQSGGPAATDAVAWATELLDADKSVKVTVWDRKEEDKPRWIEWLHNIDPRIEVDFRPKKASGLTDPPWDVDISNDLPVRIDYQVFTSREIRGVGWRKSLDEITGLTIHHTAGDWTPQGAAEYHTSKDGGTPSIHYHIWIERDGSTFLVAPLEDRLWHDNTWDYGKHMNHNLAVVLNGALHKTPPTDAQLRGLIRVIDWAMERFDIPASNVKGHMDRFSGTVCPGWLSSASGYWKRRFRVLWGKGAPDREVTGVHAAPILSAPVRGMDEELRRLERLPRKVSWYKLLYNGHPEVLDWIGKLREHEIEPVVRLYTDGSRLPHYAPGITYWVGEAIDAGARYFETMNEPNIEWAAADWRDPLKVAMLAEAWWQEVEYVISCGGRAAFPAMAPVDRGGVSPTMSGINWTRELLRWLAENHYSQAKQYVDDGRLWLAAHVSPFNKPFDYDPIRPWGVEEFCLLQYEWTQGLVYDHFGTVPPTISTEGGVYSPSHMHDLTFPVMNGWVVDDAGTALYNDESWGDYVWKLDDFLRQRGTLDGVCSWTFGDEGVADSRWIGCGWYDAGGNPRSPAQ